METSQHPNVLNEQQAAAYTGMSRSWLRQARMTGNPEGPPFLRIGRAIRYRQSDLDTWFAEHRTVPGRSAAHGATPNAGGTNA
jgi:predicted DNA-binding transcriptional regulator AlpA